MENNEHQDREMISKTLKEMSRSLLEKGEDMSLVAAFIEKENKWLKEIREKNELFIDLTNMAVTLIKKQTEAHKYIDQLLAENTILKNRPRPVASQNDLDNVASQNDKARRQGYRKGYLDGKRRANDWEGQQRAEKLAKLQHDAKLEKLRYDATHPKCGARKDKFVCNLPKGHKGDHQQRNKGRRGCVGWHNNGGIGPMHDHRLRTGQE